MKMEKLEKLSLPWSHSFAHETTSTSTKLKINSDEVKKIPRPLTSILYVRICFIWMFCLNDRYKKMFMQEMHKRKLEKTITRFSHLFRKENFWNLKWIFSSFSCVAQCNFMSTKKHIPRPQLRRPSL